MTPEEELQKFRDERPLHLEHARRIALRFGMAAIVALITCVYAFFQQTATTRQIKQYELNLQKMTEMLRAAEEKALKFETLAANETVRAQEISDQCRQNKKAK